MKLYANNQTGYAGVFRTPDGHYRALYGQEFEEIDGPWTCPASWERIMQFIGDNTQRPTIGQELVIRRDAFDYVVETRTSEKKDGATI